MPIGGLCSLACLGAGLTLLVLPLGVIGLSGDGVCYLRMAQCVASGKLPVVSGSALPPGFGVLLAPFVGDGGIPAVGIRMLLAACLGLSASLAFILYRDVCGGRAAAAVGLFVATSPVLMEQAQWVLSELPYLAISVVIVITANAVTRLFGSRRMIACVVVGAAIGALAMVRSVGLLLAPACALAIALRARRSGTARRAGSMQAEGSSPTVGESTADATNRRADPPWRIDTAAVALLLASTLMLPVAWRLVRGADGTDFDYWHMLRHARPTEGTSATGARLVVERLAHWGPQRLSEIGAALVPQTIGWSFWQSSAGAATRLLIGLGALAAVSWRLAFRRRAEDAYVLLSVALLVVWPWDEGVRLVSPLLPFCVGAIVDAVQTVAARVRSAGLRAKWPAVASVFVLLMCGVQGIAIAHAAARGPSRALRDQERRERATAIASAIASRVHAGSMLAVVPDGDDVKVDVALAGYLSGTQIDLEDCAPCASPSVSWERYATLLVHKQLAARMPLAPRCRIVSRVGAFVVVHRG